MPMFLLTSSLVIPLVTFGAQAQPAPNLAEAMRDWIGVWQTEDTYQPVSGQPTVERGVRTCGLVMQNAYLQCETVVSAGARSRTYRFLINYNRTTSRFEMLSLWSNVPHKLVQKLTPDRDGQRWIIENVAVIGDDEPMGLHWSELVFESPHRIVWTGRRLSAPTDNPSTAPISFREVWTRH
jgi:hypothetical protein